LVYGLYAVGHFGIAARIEDSKIVKSIADFQKYVCAAASTPKALFQNSILFRYNSKVNSFFL
jgi:hypothetical protein